MRYEFSNKVALITGGTSGIGLATARMFLDNGGEVALIGTQPAKGKQALQKLSSFGQRVLFLQGDVSQIANCQQVVAKTASHFGRIDVVINSAGLYLEKSITEVTPEEYQLIMDTNMKGTFFICRFAIPELRKTNGSIVNISSDAGLNGNNLCTAYCASKGAVTTFTKALALELAPDNIRVNCVCPGDVCTPLLEQQLSQAANPDDCLRDMSSIYPLGRIGQPKEIAAVVCFLASDAASFVTGAAWPVDGGLTAC